MAKGKKLPPKREVAHALLTQGAAFVHLDPRGVDVVVPDWLKRQPQLVLQIGLNMPVPIRDLRVDDTGVFGTLSFNRAPFTCMVPWHAVFALVGDDGRGMVWPDSMPPEIAQEIEREAERATRGAIADAAVPAAEAKKPRKPRSALRAVEPSGSDTSDGIERAQPLAAQQAKPAGLRLIPGQAQAGRNEPALAAGKRVKRAPHLRLVKS
jgi:stringent starvation protein B